MLTRAQAFEIVTSKLQQMGGGPAGPFMVIDKLTIERPFGWVFFYNSRKFIETGDDHYRLAGNGPVIVNRRDGSVEFFGSAKPLSEILTSYEERIAKDSQT